MATPQFGWSQVALNRFRAAVVDLNWVSIILLSYTTYVFYIVGYIYSTTNNLSFYIVHVMRQ
jgi:hypothetical protein